MFSPIWLLLFVDDIMVCFKNWGQAACLVPSLVETLQKIGLHINYEKSCLVVSSQALASAPAPHLLDTLKDFQWTSHTLYLKKPFGHTIDYDALCTRAIQCAYTAWGQIKPVLKKFHWSNPQKTLKMLDRYVGASFLWFIPIVFPHKAVQRKIQITQTTLLVEALNLYVPSTSAREAHQLLRLRRHIAKQWVRHTSPKGGWSTQSLHRLWSFLGHVCRQDFSAHHAGRVMLQHLANRHSSGLSRSGPWHTIHSLMTKCWKENDLDHDYLYAAQDRVAWQDLRKTFLDWMGHCTNYAKLELLPSNPWESKGALLRQQTHWLLTVICTVTSHDDDGHTIYLAWLDNQEGVSTLKGVVHHDHVAATPLAEVVSEGILQLESFLLMKYRPFAIQVALAQPDVWSHLCLHEALCQTHLLRGQFAWYQLFPLDPVDIASPVLQPFIFQ